MAHLLETVPNFSEGRDPTFLDAAVATMEAAGVEVIDASRDPDHHRSVVTAVGSRRAVVDALAAAADLALDRIDLRRHRGVHPRVGALDVAPVVPLVGTPRSVAVDAARDVGEALAARGIPVWWYGWSAPEPRTLGGLRRGGFEALADGLPDDRPADLPSGRRHPHPTAGVTCVGARPLLLAWNVEVEGVGRERLARLARRLRGAEGGPPGLRALALELPEQGRVQISMNLEDVERADPMAVFESIEDEVVAEGGRIRGTEVIGMIPDALVFPAADRRLHLLDAGPERLLSRRVAMHLARARDPDLRFVLDWLHEAGGQVPPAVRDAAARLAGTWNREPTPGDHA
jgi:glutamate formiminotransferase